MDHLRAKPSGYGPDHEDSQLCQWRSNAALNMQMHVQLYTRRPKDDALRDENAWGTLISWY